MTRLLTEVVSKSGGHQQGRSKIKIIENRWKSYAIQCQLRCGLTKSATRGTCGWYKPVFLDFARALYHHHIKEYVILFTNRRAPLWLVDQQKYPANTGRRNWFNHVQFQWFFDFSDVKKTLQLLPWWVGPLSRGLALTFAEFVWNRRVSVCSLCGFFAFYVFLILSRLDQASPLWCFLYQYLFASFYTMFTPWFYHCLILFTF